MRGFFHTVFEPGAGEIAEREGLSGCLDVCSVLSGCMAGDGFGWLGWGDACRCVGLVDEGPWAEWNGMELDSSPTSLLSSIAPLFAFERPRMQQWRMWCTYLT